MCTVSIHNIDDLVDCILDLSIILCYTCIYVGTRRIFSKNNPR